MPEKSELPPHGEKSVAHAMAGIIGCGLAGSSLLLFFMWHPREQIFALGCLLVGLASLVFFACIGCLTCGRQACLLLVLPAIYAGLCIVSVPWFMQFGLMIYCLMPVFLFFSFFVAMQVAWEYTLIFQAQSEMRQWVLFSVLTLAFFAFEAGSILAFPYCLGLAVDYLESFGVRLWWAS